MFKTRLIYSELFQQKENGKITILLGARQVGKTTLLRQLHAALKESHPCLFLDFRVGAPVSRRSPHRPVREQFTHTVPRFRR